MYQISSPPIIEAHKDGRTIGGIYYSPNQHYEIQLTDEVLRLLQMSSGELKEYLTEKYAEQD